VYSSICFLTKPLARSFEFDGKSASALYSLFRFIPNFRIANGVEEVVTLPREAAKHDSLRWLSMRARGKACLHMKVEVIIHFIEGMPLGESRIGWLNVHIVTALHRHVADLARLIPLTDEGAAWESAEASPHG